VRLPGERNSDDEDACALLARQPIAANGELSDAAVIERSLREPSWFAEIFSRHGPEIVRYVHARLGAGLAEDVAAEVFLAAFSCRDRYDVAQAQARPWLYGIAVRQIGKHHRAESRYRRAVARLPAEHLPADFGDRSLERVMAEQLRPQLSATLAALSRQDRELLLLVAWADLTYAESAQALGLTVSAVRSRLNRIRVKARKALGGTNPARSGEQTCTDEETTSSG
jgi:RNA polymerase sigma factor (sigma-70 family)